MRPHNASVEQSVVHACRPHWNFAGILQQSASREDRNYVDGTVDKEASPGLDLPLSQKSARQFFLAFYSDSDS